MKAVPILFSAPMVLALLAKEKTQTRRLAAPRWAAGDVLYVRENFRISQKWNASRMAEVVEKCDLKLSLRYEADGRVWDADGYDKHGVMSPLPDWMGKLRPSIYHPRARSRLSLPVTEIREERLQDISEADAIAEGVIKVMREELPGHVVATWKAKAEDEAEFTSARAAYRRLWSLINGKASWNANPTVYATTFDPELRNIDATRAAA